MMFVLVSTLLLTACPHILNSDTDKAVSEAAETLKMVYFEHNYEGAYTRFAPDFQNRYRPSDLEALADYMKEQFGTLMELKSESYQTGPGKLDITIFFDGANEKGPTYHRVAMVGDAMGYKATIIAVIDHPFPADPARKKVDHPIIINKST